MDECLALAEGGSAAFGRDDDLSDVDLGAFVKDGTTSHVAERVKEAILSVAEIEREWELPQPTWHGAWQAFYVVKGHKYMMVDICVSEETQGWDLTEVERHGRPVVLFDKGSHIKVTNIDPKQTEEEIAKRRAKAEPMVNLFHSFVDKELDRGNLIDAMHFYQRMVLFPLVDVLRAKYDPHRYDFGGRYLYHDLPKDVVKELESLYFVKDSADLRRKKARAVEMFNEVV